MEIECISGTFEAEAWHVDKYVAANPSGSNWRLRDEEVDIALAGLRTEGQTIFHGPRQLVTMSNLPDRVVIKLQDTGVPDHPGCVAILSARGREQFITVLTEVVDRAPLQKQAVSPFLCPICGSDKLIVGWTNHCMDCKHEWES